MSARADEVLRAVLWDHVWEWKASVGEEDVDQLVNACTSALRAAVGGGRYGVIDFETGDVCDYADLVPCTVHPAPAVPSTPAGAGEPDVSVLLHRYHFDAEFHARAYVVSQSTGCDVATACQAIALMDALVAAPGRSSGAPTCTDGSGQTTTNEGN